MKFMRKLPQPHIYETVHEYSLAVGAIDWVLPSAGCMKDEHAFPECLCVCVSVCVCVCVWRERRCRLETFV